MPDMEKVIKVLTDALSAKENYPWAKAEMSFEFIEMLLALLKEQETIVRCISCTFYRSNGECALHDGKWKPEGFCSWAIRKEGR